MSNNVEKSSNSEGVFGQPIRPSQSSWVAHWMKTPHDNDNVSLQNKSMEDAHGEREVSDISKSGKGLREVTETNCVKKLNSKARNSNNWKKESKDSYSPALTMMKVLRSPVDLNSRNNTVTLDANESHFQPEGSENFGQPVKYQYYMEKNRLAKSSFYGDCMGSTSNTKHGCNGKSLAVQALMCVPEQISQSDTKLVQKDYQNSKASATSLLRKNDGNLLLRDTSTSNYQVPNLFGESYRNIQTPSDIRFFPNQINLPQVEKSAYSNHGHCVLEKVPFSVHDIETTRVQTIVESTRHKLIIRKSEVNLSEVGQIIRESAVLNKPCADFGRHGLPGLKLEPLDSATDSEGHGNMRVCKTSKADPKHESSAETDIMDMEPFKDKYNLTDLALFVSNKESMRGKNVCSTQVKLSSYIWNTELPDINIDPPVDGEPSTSRTQSLDVDHLFSNADQSPGSNPSSRWVKRLKMSGSDLFSHGTKSLKLEIASSSKKRVNKFFEILKGSITTKTEPASNTNHGAHQMVPLLESGKKSEDITLSHFWIRRWCRNQNLCPRRKPKAVVVCEPQSSKTALKDFQKEQFPSIAAMALMGKAMNGFRPCVFRKRGSLLVWTTKEP